MKKFYGIISKQVKQVVEGEKTVVNKSFVIDLNSTQRVTAVKEAEEVARKQKATLEGVYVPNNLRKDAALTMTKAFKERKKERAGVRKTKTRQA